MAQHYVYRFYAELQDYEPKIWRLFEINGEKTMSDLAYALMVLFEMEASHYFRFTESVRIDLLDGLRPRFADGEIQRAEGHSVSRVILNRRYELPNDEALLVEGEELVEANKITLNQLRRGSEWRLSFEYDYGDGWEVALTLVGCKKREVYLRDLPHVLEGEGFGIVEDIGGTSGLAALAAALRKGTGREYDNYCSWLDCAALDLDGFDQDDMNFRLKKLPRVYRDIYESHLPPSEKMLSVILREYQGRSSER